MDDKTKETIARLQRSAANCFRYAETCRDLYERSRKRYTKGRQRQAQARLWAKAMGMSAKYARDARALLQEWIGE